MSSPHLPVPQQHPSLPPMPAPWRPVLPPPPPLEPRYSDPQHVVHVLLTLFSFGLWLPIWILCAWSANNNNVRARRAYEQQYASWQQAYWLWQHGVS